jgi:DHA1 family bicyclomycin/chloramphenicol resistance-like MFS transporter
MAILVVLGVSAIDIYIASLPQMVSEFNSQANIINLTISAYTFGIAFGVLFIGDFSNRFGRRNTLLSGIIIFTISSLLIALASSIHLIILLRLIQALGCSGFIIVPRMIIRDVMNEKEQINANGILLLGMIISPAVAPILGAYIGKYLGWKFCFVLSSLVGAVMTCVIYKLLPETNQNKTNQLTNIRQYLVIYKSLLTNSAFISLTFIYAATVGAYFAFLGISSYLYIDYWHISPVMYSYLFILLASAYFAGNQIMRILNKKGLRPASIIGIGVYFSAAGVGLLILSNILFSSIMLMDMVSISVILMRTANAIIIPPTQIRIMSNFAPYSAQALGLNMCIGFIVNSAATYTVTVLNYSPLISLIILSFIPILISIAIYKKYYSVM